jgi:hypothetical protein
MSVIKLHERLEKIEAAYLAALGDRYPEVAFRHSVWQAEILPVILEAVPDASQEEIIEMFHWRRRKLKRQNDELERKGDEAMRALRERKW